jgi:predicted amidohydrolase
MTLIIAAAQSTSIAGGIESNVASHLRFGTIAAEHGAQLVVFPELSLTGYEPDIARSSAICPEALVLGSLRCLAQEAHMTLVVGAPILNDNDKLHIAGLAIRPDGSTLNYTKEYLHPGEEQTFVPGSGGPAFLIGDTNVALAICADTTHSQHPAAAAASRANVYAAGVLITKNGYDADTALLKSYTLEHGMAVLMANYSGFTGGWASAGRSAIWSEDGKLVAASGGTDQTLVIGRKKDGVWDGMVLPVT